MIEIKQLPASKWEIFRKLRLEALQQESAAFCSSYEEEQEYSEKEWKKHTNDALIAFDNSEPIGMLMSYRLQRKKLNHVANFAGIYVKKEYRGKGIGKQLLKTAVSTLKEQEGIIKINLSVNKEKTAALKLYKKCGFREIGTLKNDICVDGIYYDEIMMEMHLR